MNRETAEWPAIIGVALATWWLTHTFDAKFDAVNERLEELSDTTAAIQAAQVQLQETLDRMHRD